MNRPNPLVFLLFFLSGATGLVYELIWTRELIFVFGGTTYAISTVLVAFMAGLGLGSYLCGRYSRSIRDAARFYGLLEIAIGVYALLVPYLLDAALPIYRAIYPFAEKQPLILALARFVVGAIVLLLPTTMMGATLPILVRHVARQAGQAARWVGILYGINTLGAVLGTLACGFVLIPRLGLTATTICAAIINIAIGVTALLVLRSRETATIPTTETARVVPLEPLAPDTPVRWLLTAFALSGFAAMVYQIAWTRVLILSIGSSTYSFTCILAAFILGLALGSIAIARVADRLERPVLWIGVIQLATGAAAVVIQPLFGHVPELVYALVGKFRGDFAAMLAAQLLLVILITLVPTLLMGTLFPLITRVVAAGDRDPAAAAGRAYAANTVGTVFGSFLAGFVLIRGEWEFLPDNPSVPPVFGAQRAIVFAALLNGAIGVWLIRLSAPAGRPMWRGVAPALLGVAIIAAAGLLPGGWDRLTLNSGVFRSFADPALIRDQNVLLYSADGPDLTVAVMQLRSDARTLSISVNGKADASTGLDDMTTQLLLGHIPMLLNPQAKRVCVIGLGSGMTLGAVSRYPQVERMDCVEISEEVIRANAYFAPWCYEVIEADPRTHVFRNDGRNHLLLTDQKYDVIISEPSNPWIAGVANLFTREFFEICDRRLNEGGVYCLWLQGYTISLENFQLVVRTLAERFPFVSIWETSESDFAVVAGRRPFQTPIDDLRRRFEHPPVRQDMYRIASGRLPAVLGRFVVAGAPVVDWFGKSHEIHTDDNAILEFSTPKQLHLSTALEISRQLAAIARPPWANVIALDDANPADVLLRRRVEDALAARALSLESDWAMRQQQPPERILRPLIEALRRDPGNLPAFERMVRAQESMKRNAVKFLNTPAGEAILREIAACRVPTLASREWRSYEDIVVVIRALAADSVEKGRPELAADYLSEACELTPAAADVRLDYVAALSALGELDRAMSELKAAVSGGVVPAARLTDAPGLDALRSRADFIALLPGATSRP